MRQHPVVFFPPLLQPHSFTVVCFKGSARLKPSPLVQAYFCKANAFLSALWYQRRGSHLCKPHFASIFSQHMSSKLFKNWQNRHASLVTRQNMCAGTGTSGNRPLVMSHTVQYLFHVSGRIGPLAPPWFSVPFKSSVLAGNYNQTPPQGVANRGLIVLSSGDLKSIFYFCKLSVWGCSTRVQGE